MTKLITGLALVLGISSVADAKTKSPVRGGKAITMRLGKVRERVHQLTYAARGWALSLELPMNGSICSAELVDVTPKAFAMRFRETIVHHTKHEGIVLSAERYTPGHAYRMTVQCADHGAGTAIVYLAPLAMVTKGCSDRQSASAV